MSRPTIKDLSLASGVSVATVNRVLAGQPGVRQQTRALVQEAAERVGFYGLGAIQARVAASRPKFRLGVLLLQPHRPFYQNVAAALRQAAGGIAEAEIDLRIEFLEDLSPQNTAERALALAKTCEAISITSAVHPVVMQAVEQIEAQGVHVFALISQLSATGQVHYIGVDNWKVGRTAGWTMAQVCKAPGKLGILMGNPRYRNQEMNETGFRSYFREFARDFTLLEPMSTFESAAVAQEMTERMLADHPDLAGLYVAGGGISGALAALRAAGQAGRVVLVGYELMEITRAALLDGTMTLAIAHPLERLAQQALAGMVAACKAARPGGNWTSVVPFEIYTRENI
jgi:LacI family transcriptional regulator